MAGSIPGTQPAMRRRLIAFALPLMLSNFFQQMYSTIDAAIVGTYAGDAALGAIGSAGQLIVFLIYFFIGISIGASICISRSFGEGNGRGIHRQIHTAILLAVISGAILTVVGLLLAPAMLGLMNLSGEVLELGVDYIRTFFLGTIPMMLYNMSSGILRGVGDSRTPLYSLIAAGIVNVALDVLFVPVLGLGVVGAAAATALAQLVSAIWLMIKLCRAQGIYKLECRRLRIYKKELYEIVKIGIPSGLQSVLITFSNVIVQAQVNCFGIDVMAGVTAFLRIEGILFMPIEAMGLAISNFVGQTVGEGKRTDVGAVTFCGMKIIVVVTLVIEAGMLLCGRLLLGMFTSGQALEYGYQMLLWLIPLYFFYAINQTLVGSIRGMGNAFAPMRITLISMCALRVTWILTGMHFFGDLVVIFTSFPVTWMATTACLVVCYRRTRASLM